MEKNKRDLNDLLSRRIGQHGRDLEEGLDELERFYQEDPKYGERQRQYVEPSPERLSAIKKMEKKMRQEAKDLQNVKAS